MKKTFRLLMWSLILISSGSSIFSMKMLPKKLEQPVTENTTDVLRRRNAFRLLEIIRSKEGERLEAAKRILEEPVDLDYYHEKLKITPLRATIAMNQIEIAELLFEKGASVRPPSDPLSPLGTAATYGNTDFIELLLKHGALVTERDASQITPTAIAAEQKRSEGLRVLLKAGGNPNEVRPDGNSLLVESITQSNHTITQILLQKGADANLEDEHGHVPFGKAVSHGNLNAMTLLRDHKVDIRRKNPRGSSAFHLAAYFGRIKALQLLQEWWPEGINEQDYIGRTPFFWAVTLGKQDMIEYLLEEKVDLTVTFINGESILEWLKREYPKAYNLVVSTHAKKKAPGTQKKSRKTKKNRNKKTFNQRQEGKQEEPPVYKERVIETKPPIDPKVRATELNDLMVYTDDGSCVLSDNGEIISFGYKHLNYEPTERIYCLRSIATCPTGPRITYHPSIIALKKEFLTTEGLKHQIVSYCNSEALERMSGHSIRAHYVDKKGRRIHNRLFFGTKLLGGKWTEGIFVLAFAQLQGEYTCFYSSFLEKSFNEALRNFEISADEQAVLETALDKITHR